MRGNRYQIALITSGMLVTVLLACFFFRELFPEYKVYQKRYVELEKFRSEYTGENIPPFRFGIKQVVLENPDKGPFVIDRCTSCHVALNLPHFSQTRLEPDENGVLHAKDNPDYVFHRLDQAIEDLKNRERLQKL